MGAKLAEASAAATDAAATGAEHALKQTSVGEAALRAENEQLLRRLTAAMEELRVAMDSAAQAHRARRSSWRWPRWSPMRARRPWPPRRRLGGDAPPPPGVVREGPPYLFG